jgi:hypothetical protein
MAGCSSDVTVNGPLDPRWLAHNGPLAREFEEQGGDGQHGGRHLHSVSPLAPEMSATRSRSTAPTVATGC